ncbi:serpin family protein, partial [Salmonella enterica]
LASESGFLKGKLPRRKVRVHTFKIPKFKISYTLEASNLLKELGVVSPFSQLDADFTKMGDSPSEGGVSVESMFHKVSIEVDAQCTKATAAAGSLLGTY